MDFETQPVPNFSGFQRGLSSPCVHSSVHTKAQAAQPGTHDTEPAGNKKGEPWPWLERKSTQPSPAYHRTREKGHTKAEKSNLSKSV
ncbi:hypothetical protein BaRGS_00027916 [Batillaria attramentaria]|uniref:Uncharacterized protein n=1 Tax=Batillaria attramentaria TaxID=370345 RepID=A0ABD0K0E3_9CAEN